MIPQSEFESRWPSTAYLSVKNAKGAERVQKPESGQRTEKDFENSAQAYSHQKKAVSEVHTTQRSATEGATKQ